MKKNTRTKKIKYLEDIIGEIDKMIYLYATEKNEEADKIWEKHCTSINVPTDDYTPYVPYIPLPPITNIPDNNQWDYDDNSTITWADTTSGGTLTTNNSTYTSNTTTTSGTYTTGGTTLPITSTISTTILPIAITDKVFYAIKYKIELEKKLAHLLIQDL